jgi:phosphoglycerate kinase
MIKFNSLLNANIYKQNVLLRVDLNVPVVNKNITDDTRIKAILPTIQYLVKNQAKVILISHFGRPEGVFNQDMSLKLIANYLANMVDFTVNFAPDCIGEIAQKAVNKTDFGSVLVLENLRFYKEETAGDIDFAKNLASFANVYVNDTFSSSHRAHASITTITQFLPSFAGLLMQYELDNLNNLLQQPKQPMLAIVGGAKVSTKINLLNTLSQKAKAIFIGGGMANTFLFALGYQVGKSLCEKDFCQTAINIIKEAKNNNCEIILPNDVVVAKAFKADAINQNLKINHVSADDLILDIGSETIKNIIQQLNFYKTVVWNGPLGAFELNPFHFGTISLATEIAIQTQKNNLISIAGGGDIVSALNSKNLAEKFTYISTAGGAFLEWLEGKDLPGISALKNDCLK